MRPCTCLPDHHVSANSAVKVLRNGPEDLQQVGRMSAATSNERLQEAVKEHIRAADAEFGVYIRHLPSGATVSVNPDSLYLMASVFKIPIMLEALAQVDEGEFRLEERIELRQDHQLPTSMILGNLQHGLKPTLRDLLTAMITVSDNTATDMVLNRVGIERVARRLRSWGLHSTSLRMSVQGLFDAGFSRPDDGIPVVALYRKAFAEGPIVDPLTGSVHEGLREAMKRGANWDAVPAQRSLENNVSSPRDMGTLLERLVQGELLSPEGTYVALDILLRQQLNQRLPRYLPPGAAMGHKTGTFYSSRNDAGVLYLRDGGKVVVVTFGLMSRERSEGDPLETVPYIDGVDQAMGRIARSTYDFFSGQSG
jgi:beta-lactamase class A